MKIKVCLICLILGGLGGTLPAEYETISFERLTMEHGLSQSAINCITKDNDGFMWFGTQDGLNRYDGYNFKVFYHNPNDRHSLSDNHIRVILKDKAGTLWIGTHNGGLNKLKPGGHQFIRCTHDPDNPASLSNNQVFAIYEDREGTLWIGTWGGGLNKFDRENKTFIHYSRDPKKPGSISHNVVRCLFEDKNNVLWIGTYGGGLNRFDREKNTFTHYLHSPDNPNSLSNNRVMAICETSRGELWVGTNGGGIGVLDRKRGTFKHHKHNPRDPGSLSNDAIRTIYQDWEGHIWVGTYGGGINIFDPIKKTFHHFSHEPQNPYSLSHNRVMAIYEDNAEMIWIGTLGGISVFDRIRPNFNHYQHNPMIPNSLSSNYVRAICRDRAGTLWVGTNGNGLDRLDRGKQAFTRCTSDPANPHSISYNRIFAIYEDRAGVLWVGTFGGGLNKFDRETNAFIHYRHDPRRPTSLSHDRIRTLCEDKSGGLWVGTFGGGLNQFDREKETFTHYKHQHKNPNSLTDDRVMKVDADKSGMIWIGTFGGGLDAFEPVTKTFKHYKHIPGDSNSLSDNRVFSICEDHFGILWVGCDGGGINKFDRTKNRWTCYTEKDGLPNNVIYGILEDRNSNLWLSTNKGLSKFNPRREMFFNYDIRDGLQCNEFNTGSYYKDRRDREMFFGGINGFISFFPEDIKDNPYIPPVIITSFKKFNREVPFNQPLSEIGEIKLAYKDNFFSFEFVALNYRASEKNQYAYRLEPFDREWINCGSRRYASYTNLSGGSYVFRVRGSNNHGVWNDIGSSIRVEITPPFWETWWLRGAVLMILLVLVYFGFRIRLYYIKVSHMKEKSKELEEINEELRQQIREREAAEKGKKLLEQKLVLYEKMEAIGRLAGGVAHDLNNVLSAIVGYPDLLLMQLPGDSPLRKPILTMRRSAMKAAAIVEDLLTMARRGVDIKEVANLNQIVNDYLQSPEYEKLCAAHPDVQIQLELANDLLNIAGSPVHLSKMVMNLVSNAAEAMPEGGTITVATKNFYPKNRMSDGVFNYIVLTVTDTGIGIEEEDLKKIFEPFYTKKRMGRSGTGLGLAVVWNTVNDHQGHIDVASEKGKGTSFEIYLPVTEKHRPGKKPTAGLKDYFGKGEHVLVADDMEDQREMAASLLKELGYVVTTVSSGEEAIEYLKTHSADLLVLDMIMPPGIDGLDTYREIRKINPDIRTIITSGFSETDRVGEAQRLGAGPYVKKPFSLEHIARMIKNELEKGKGK